MDATPLPELLAFLDAQPEPRILLDLDYRIVAANRAYAQEFGDGHSLAGRHCYEVSHGYTVPCDRAGENCPLRASLQSGTPQRTLHLHHTPRGEEHVDVETTPLRDAKGEIAFFVETLATVRHASSQPTAAGLVGRSPGFNAMLELATRVAPTDASVLLLGETGTGKELVARLVHEASRRAAGPFVAVDCSGLTESLFESELFGHEKGAFTGALHRKRGLVEAASGGTLFLDELGDIPLGHAGQAPAPAGNRHLSTSGGRGNSSLGLPPRRRHPPGPAAHDRSGRLPCRPLLPHQRLSDPRAGAGRTAGGYPLLAQSFLERVAPGRGLRFSPATLDALASRAYPGNIRELRNLVERATILADGLEVGPAQFADDVIDGSFPALAATARSSPPGGFAVDEILPLEDLTTRYLHWADASFHGNRRDLADRLGVAVRTLYRKLSKDEGDGTQDGDTGDADPHSP